jgi:bifunctional DNA-binding transcriptional regulator/antitoxin component of YhaV-PrlF toxin-antitoxin module
MDKLGSIQTVRTRAQMLIFGFRASMSEEKRRPNEVRETLGLQGMQQVQAYDGKSAWQVNPFEGRKDPELLSADDSKSLIEDADIEGQLVDYKQQGSTAELLGHDSVEGTDCYKIKLTLKNGDIFIYYLDTDSALELKRESQSLIRGAVRYREEVYGDYEQVNGIYFPFAIDSSEKGSPDHIKITVEKMEVNVPLANDLFTAPVIKPQPKTPSGQ